MFSLNQSRRALYRPINGPQLEYTVDRNGPNAKRVGNKTVHRQTNSQPRILETVRRHKSRQFIPQQFIDTFEDIDM